jgi:homoserine dehydrogenase
MDVAGRDAAQKLALLASLAFNARVSEADLFVEGIDRLQAADIQFAGELGYVIKLLAIAERSQGPAAKNQGSENADSEISKSPLTPAPSPLTPVCLRVHPTLVHKTDVLAEVGGSFNAISVYGNAVGHTLFYGRGAGQMPTASAVVADMINVGLGIAPLAFKQLNVFPDSIPPAKTLPIEQLQSRYYLRLMARDEPGVLAQITKILGENKISLSAILQHETADGQNVPVIITTHRANEGAMRNAVGSLDKLKTLAPPAVCLRIIDQPKEFAAG